MQKPPNPGLLVILILGALSAFAPLSIDMYLPSLPSLTRELNTSAAVAQLTLTACLVGLALGQITVGPISDLFGRRKPLLTGVAIFTVSSLLCAVVPWAWALVVLRFVQGASGAAGIVSANATVRDFYEGQDAARFFSRLMLVSGAAPVLAPVFGGQLLRITSWRGVFIVLATIGLALFIAASTLLHETLPAERRRTGGLATTGRSFKALLTDPGFIGYAIPSGLVMSAMFAYISGSPFVLQNIYGVSPQTFSLLFAVNSVGIVAAGQVSGQLIGRVRPERVMVTGLALVTLGGISLLTATIWHLGLGQVLASLFVVVSSLGLIGPNAMALAQANHPYDAGSASGLMGVANFMLGATIAPLVGIAGPQNALPMAILIPLLGASALAVFGSFGAVRGRRAMLAP